MEIGDIYYLSDQYGPKFVKIIMIGDIWKKDDNWAYFYKSNCLNNIIKSSFIDGHDNGCDKAQLKKWHFEKLIERFTFSDYFRGCIKIPNDVIESITKNNNVNISKYPYMDRLPDRILCKHISKEDFRNIKLDKILS